jgi:hypothetical protein
MVEGYVLAATAADERRTSGLCEQAAERVAARLDSLAAMPPEARRAEVRAIAGRLAATPDAVSEPLPPRAAGLLVGAANAPMPRRGFIAPPGVREAIRRAAQRTPPREERAAREQRELRGEPWPE